MLKQELLSERNELIEIISLAKQKLGQAPAGSLNISCSEGRIQFYQRGEVSCGRKYLGREERDTALQLAQKSYDEQVIKQATKELRVLDRMLASMGIEAPGGRQSCAVASSGERRARSTQAAGKKRLRDVEAGENQRSRDIERLKVTGSLRGYRAASVERVYEDLGSLRQGMIVPYVLPDDEYAKSWEEEQSRERLISDMGCSFLTEKGDRVRSKSEVIIADKLFHSGISYIYERPIYLEGMGDIHPDFLVLNKRTRKEYVWEHFGLMDDPDYRENTMRKINAYASNGIVLGEGLVATFETANSPLSVELVGKMIATHFL